MRPGATTKRTNFVRLPAGVISATAAGGCDFTDNARHRALFTLPPVKPSCSTELAVQALPARKAVTGDEEIDAVLWLREVIGTGQDDLIAKAMEAAKLITTPLKTLEDRYARFLTAQNPGHFMAAMASFNFANLESLAKDSIDKRARQREAQARFGDGLFDKTPAEVFSLKALRGLKRKTHWFDEAEVDARYDAHADLMPRTLSDCLHELGYWDELYSLRYASCGAGDSHVPEEAREWYAFRCLGRIAPRSREEALAVFSYLEAKDRMNHDKDNKILRNLIGGQAEALHSASVALAAGAPT